MEVNNSRDRRENEKNCSKSNMKSSNGTPHNGSLYVGTSGLLFLMQLGFTSLGLTQTSVHVKDRGRHSHWQSPDSSKLFICVLQINDLRSDKGGGTLIFHAMGNRKPKIFGDIVRAKGRS